MLTWEDALAHAVEATAAGWPEPLSSYTWGERNRSSVRHPMSRGLPLLSFFLDVESRALPGDTDMPRIQTPTHGASERLSVSPGREEDGLFHMPGGQSGHPLSPYYGAGHSDWEEGGKSRLLPGPATFRLTLVPARIYFKGPRAKVEIALAKGREGRDRRREIQDRDQRREVERDYKQRLG